MAYDPNKIYWTNAFSDEPMCIRYDATHEEWEEITCKEGSPIEIRSIGVVLDDCIYETREEAIKSLREACEKCIQHLQGEVERLPQYLIDVKRSLGELVERQRKEHEDAIQRLPEKLKEYCQNVEQNCMRSETTCKERIKDYQDRIQRLDALLEDKG